MSSTFLRLSFALAAALPLAACLSFGAKPPPTLMSLTPDATVPAGTARSFTGSSALFVLVPAVPQSLATPRVAVQVSPTDIAYLPKAQWVDTPNKLFRNLLAETIAAKTGRVVAEPRDGTVAVDMRLGGRLLSFGLDAQARSVVVTYDASLIRTDRGPVETKRFEARAPVSSEKGPAIALALNRAANQVAAEVASWIG
jgi:cholesterol transport system auxiliary component